MTTDRHTPVAFGASVAVRAMLAGACILLALQSPRLAHAEAAGSAVRSEQGGRDEHRPDPCEQLFKVPGDANGLLEQCEGKGGGAGVAKGDFNGDGFADLAVGSPFESVVNLSNAGAVHVIYGSAAGLTATGDQVWSEASIPSGAGPAVGELFGRSLASGDFNGDGFADLAIGVPGQGRFSGGVLVEVSGAVHVLYGSASGLTTGGGRQYITAVDDVYNGEFGSSMVWADFDKDGFGDLAVGAPKAEAGLTLEFGQVMVYYGSGSGLQRTARQQVVTQHYDGDETCSKCIFLKGDRREAGDRLGSVLSAGDLNGDTYSDLVVGAPYEDIEISFGPTYTNAGAVHIVYGGPSGLSKLCCGYANDPRVLSQYVRNVSGAAEGGDLFGYSLAVGDFNNDLYQDLAVGAPYEDIGSVRDAGSVQIFYGSLSGPTVGNDVFWDQSQFPGQAVEEGDRFGWSLAAGRFNSGNYADLAIGAPGQDVGSLANAGVVHIAYGSTVGVQTSTAAQTWSMNSTGVALGAAAGDQFGFALTAWNFGNGDRADLVIGVPYREVTLAGTTTVRTDAGGLLVLYGQFSGLTSSGTQFWTLESPGIEGTAQTSGRFGYALY